MPSTPSSATPSPALGPDASNAATGPPDTPGEELRMVPLRGMTLAVRSAAPPKPTAGAARRPPLPAALFVHGLGGSSENWKPLMEQLAGSVRTEAIDLPGFGWSPPPDDSDYSVSGHTRAVIQYLDLQATGPVHLFGNSLGGAVATRVAAVRPDLVHTLTLVSPALPELPPQRTAITTAMMGVPGVPALYTRMTRDWSVERRARELFALCYGNPSSVSERELAAAVQEYQRRLELPYFWDVMARTTRGIIAAYTRGGGGGLWRQARKVRAPVLLVYGIRDKLVSYRMARRAWAAFGNARLLVIPESGHVAMLEHPGAVARGFHELLGVVQDLETSGGS